MKDATDITIILDRSGSMTGLESDVVGGINTLLTDQKETEGQCNVTLVQFDGNDPYEILRDNQPLKEVSLLKLGEFVPRGSTPLYDAIGRGIHQTGKRLSDLEESKRPNKVIFVIVTDGGENSSREFKQNIISNMVKLQTDEYNWEFVYIGANQDALETGASVGIMASNSLNYCSTPDGTHSMYQNLSRKLGTKRTVKGASMAWSPEEREDVSNEVTA